MRTPMPSPRGTNHARLFVNSNPRGAYDAALSEESAAALLAFLHGKLSDADLAEFCKMAGIDAGMSMDEPEPFKGMPLPGGGKFGQDSTPAKIAQVRALASRIRVSG
jgi:hypothetical protein